MRWRISLLPQMWIVLRRDSDTYNQHTGKLIKISEYWINENFVVTPPEPKQKNKGFNIQDLKDKFQGEARP